MAAAPDHHFMYIDPTLGADWLFVAAKRYVIHFQPVVVSDYDLIGYVPQKTVVVITTLSRRDKAKKIAEDIKKRFPRAIHDPLVYDFPQEMQLTLDGRVQFDQRFGLPGGDLPGQTQKGH